ncbi:hypothetical protein [Flavobacterium aquidurense]|uniref:Uncharacterized protein n=1 Tax=Flavobacterium aquidurense TaxID=362413 RepID=A0A0Q0SCT7_9FLAO|nr:hypothetical protein [Flavobacterium aquidurense]KQB42744.1 hypothetical protein RC62_3751 [Flavobacterium aquidurense]
MKDFNIKRIYVLVSLIFIFFFSNFTQHKYYQEFSFDKLRNEKIVFKDISLGNGYQIYDDRISAIVEAKNIGSKIYSIKISNTFPIYHGCYDSIPNSVDVGNGEYIQFYDKKINISSLLKMNLDKLINSNEVYIVFTSSIDFFKFNGQDFILLSAKDRRFFRNLQRNYWILLQVENKDIVNSFAFIDGYTSNNDCFGDFNNDGLLDYMNWDFNKRKITLHSLRNDKFEIDKEHYVKLKQSKEQTELVKETGIIMLYDLFDRKNSKWFYKL